MTERAKHAFGSLENIDVALSNGTIDSYDILFVKDANGKPYVGWIDKEGRKVIVDDSAELAELETELATKVSAKEVDAKIGQMVKRYEITSVPTGTLVDYGDKEIRIMCPADAVWTKQSVGEGGDPNSYYCTLKTYAPNDDVVGYIEHLGNQVDSEILTDLKTDEYGRKYQLTWLALAKYDGVTDTWTYYGKNSNEGHYIGYDYQIDFYNADGVMIASDSVRISLANEDCYSVNVPYYVGAMEKKIEEKITAIETKIEENSSYEIVEF